MAKATGTPDIAELEKLREEFLIDKATAYGAVSFYDFLKPVNKNKKIYACNGSASCMLSNTQDDWVCIMSARGKVDIRASISDEVKPGILSTTFHFPDILMNLITSNEHDCEALCLEYKVVAVNIRKSKGENKKKMDKIVQS